MAADCISQVNFDPDLTTLQFGRPVEQYLPNGDFTTNSTLDGKFTGTHAGTVFISQDVTYTNGTTGDIRVTPVFIRPYRRMIGVPPQTAFFQEWWGLTTGVAPGVPALAFNTQFGGGAFTNFGTSRQWLFGAAAAAYAPFGQTNIPPGQAYRIKYECRLVTAGVTSSTNRYAFAGSHRILFLGSIVRDPAVP